MYRYKSSCSQEHLAVLLAYILLETSALVCIRTPGPPRIFSCIIPEVGSGTVIGSVLSIRSNGRVLKQYIAVIHRDTYTWPIFGPHEIIDRS